jgi:hypothetical protein
LDLLQSGHCAEKSTSIFASGHFDLIADTSIVGSADFLFVGKRFIALCLAKKMAG